MGLDTRVTVELKASLHGLYKIKQKEEKRLKNMKTFNINCIQKNYMQIQVSENYKLR
jgi:hypothetical protein